jgi:hypothetical protein
MAFQDYSTTPAANTTIGDSTFIGPNMPRDNVRPALQQLAADGKELSNTVTALATDGVNTDPLLRSDLAQETGGALVGFNIQSADSRERTLQDKGREVPSVFDFDGIYGDGVGDDYAALQAAIDHQAATGEKILFSQPSVRFQVSDTLVIDHDNCNFEGFGGGLSNNKVLLRATSADPLLLVNGRYGRISNLGFSGNDVALHCVVLKNASQIRFEHCDLAAATSHGLLFSPTYGGGADGNNNLARISGGQFVLNGGAGIWSTQHGDNNGLQFDMVNSSSNDSHGLMLKTEGCLVMGGVFEGNGGFGIVLGEDSDPASSVGGRILYPWIESNTSGGVYGSAKSAGNLVCFGNMAQTYSEAAAANNMLQTMDTGGNLIWSNDGSTKFFWTASGALVNMGIGQATGPTDIDLGLYAKGAGRIKPQQDVDLLTGKVLRVNGTQVVGARGAAVADATDAATVITQLNALLARLRAHGLIAP